MEDLWLQSTPPKQKLSPKSKSSIRKLQKEAITHMLQLSYGEDNSLALGDSKHEEQNLWKILVYDSYGRDIIAPLLRVSELRSLGVTLHLLLSSERQPIPEVPAVYLVSPTEQNISRICEDLEEKMYEQCYLNFTSSLSRNLLERIAESAVRASAVPHVAKVYDMYTSFVSLEDDLFELEIKDCYYTIHQPSVSNVKVEQTIDAIVSGLFSVFVTLASFPVIRAQKGGPAEMVAHKLDDLLRDHLTARSSLFVGKKGGLGSHFQRPLLILMDRDIELHVMFHHSWTYQALMHDCLQLHLNRVIVKETSSAGSSTTSKTYDLDPEDEFLIENAGVPFPQVAENVEKALESYKQEINEINRKTGSVGEELLNEESDNVLEAKAAALVSVQNSSHDSSNDLASSVAKIPVLMKKKRTIDLHTSIASALLDCIKERSLDAFFQLEDALMSKPSLSHEQRQSVYNLVKDVRGSKEDKIRLVLIYYLFRENISSEEIRELKELLTGASCSISPITYLEQLRKMNKVTSTSLLNLKRMSSGSNSTVPFHFESIMSRVVEQGYKGLTQVAESLKKLIPSNKAFMIARIVESLMENNKTSESESFNFLFLDPKVRKGKVVESQKISTPFQDAIVFVVGGGNYVEYQNLKDHSRKDKHIIYGSTDMVSSNEFLHQLSRLGDDHLNS
ncbi:protein transporter [Galdieria sulphuraria]|uniref:Protein transporter n=1 Tax=Galdieria sulphuraria TaxID=130081 RepID=M2X5D2_GALSU|nr:protein transporter [Galdieria sulphuraria]EME31700.1 protein transporter [Galdieria sulphuraria]|eukprot:XP_005708220.1 protein transporter [Galdieria sulphuraria]